MSIWSKIKEFMDADGRNSTINKEEPHNSYDSSRYAIIDVEVGLKDIEISDDQDVGGAVGNIISMIYKGDHYQLIVRTDENEEDFVFDTEDTWNENDRVSVIIPKEKIKLTLKQEIRR